MVIVLVALSFKKASNIAFLVLALGYVAMLVAGLRRRS
jgi:hypothetical protein